MTLTLYLTIGEGVAKDRLQQGSKTEGETEEGEQGQCCPPSKEGAEGR